jgi:pyruvate ferredoxin oxidoreductase alpha subunit
MIRPFPAGRILDALRGRRAVAVIDQNLSPGLGGILYHEIAAALAASLDRPRILRSFVGGLGGKDISQAEFDHVLERLRNADPDTDLVESELLMTNEEREYLRSRLQTAGKQREEAVSCD